MNPTLRIEIHDVTKRYWLFDKYRERVQQTLLAPLLGRDFARPFIALKGVSFDLNAGEVLGVIGRNGSGKSTLLQIISGTLQPTQGQVVVNGRLTALLELGAGFHPEFTGRENVFLSGATLGISEKEMKKRFDQITAFSGIGDFIDQPVKLYSSGMYVRLAFSIVTSLDPDILVVDEALAVGDAGFVIKCMNRMKQLKDQGTAILLVTHDIQTVRSFCDKVLWLDKGEVKGLGAPGDITSQYIQSLWNPADVSQSGQPSNSLQPSLQRGDLVRWGNGGIRIENVEFNQKQTHSHVVELNQSLEVEVFARAEQAIASGEVGIGIGFRNQKGLDVIVSTTFDAHNFIPPLAAGQRIRAKFKMDNILAPGDYALVVNIEDRGNAVPQYYDFIENAHLFKVVANQAVFSLVAPPVEQELEILHD